MPGTALLAAVPPLCPGLHSQVGKEGAWGTLALQTFMAGASAFFQLLKRVETFPGAARRKVAGCHFCLVSEFHQLSVRQRRISQATEGLRCVLSLMWRGWSFAAVQSLGKQRGILALVSTRNVLKGKIIQTQGNEAMLWSCTTSQLRSKTEPGFFKRW